MRGAAKGEASEELERRSQHLSSLIRRTRISKEGDQVKKEVVKAEVKPMRREGQRKQEGDEEEEEEKKKKKGAREVDQCDGNPPLEQQQQNTPIVKVRAADMPVALQKRAFRCAHEMLASMPKLESKRLAFALKKEFDSTYGPAWHCIVGTSFGSYVTHSLGGFLYFSIDKVYILLFRTAVEPIDSQGS